MCPSIIPPPRKRGDSVTYADYKLFMADLSQVCDGRTLVPKTKHNAKDERVARGSKACQEVTTAIDKLRADIGLGSSQEYCRSRTGNKTRRPFDDQPSRSRGDSSNVATSSDPRAPRRSSSRGKDPRPSSDASFSARSSDVKAHSSSPAVGKDGTGGNSSVSRRSSSPAVSRRSSSRGKDVSRSSSDAPISASAGDPKAPRRSSSPAATASRSGSDPSIATKSGDRCPSPAAGRGEDSTDPDGAAAASSRSSSPAPSDGDVSNSTASCPGASRRDSSCERTVASCPGASSSSKKSAPAYRRAASLPSDGPLDQPRAILRKKYRPRHHSAILNRQVEGIMRPSKYSATAADPDAAIARAVAAFSGSGSSAAAGSAANSARAVLSCRRSSLPAITCANSKDSLRSLASTEGSSRESSWSDSTSWVPTAVDFSAHMEVYIYERK